MRRALARARKDKKSDFFLRMAPSDAADDAHRPPIGIPVRELLVQAYNYRRDRLAREFTLHSIFTVIFFYVIVTLQDGNTAANTNRNIYNAFMGQQAMETPAGRWLRCRHCRCC